MQNGFTPLIVATQNCHADIITALLEAKADPNITEKVDFFNFSVLSMLITICIYVYRPLVGLPFSLLQK